MQINWPNNITTASFLHNYWQQKPLLIPAAFPDFENPLDENELAGLACDADANARFMQHVQGDEWRMCTGPLDESFFNDITGNKWSLLVSDIEKLLPDFRDYLQPFRFLPDWRIDDLMISYAPVGGSVGAHIDQYDVFLLQSAGVREWQIENSRRQGPQQSASEDISLLGDFSVDETMRLGPGDMLYLPPHFAHHGIAKEDPCMTWSIGFRAPSVDEMLPSILNYVIDELRDTERYTERYTDAGRFITANPGLITDEDQRKLRQMLRTALHPDDTQLDEWIGRYLTESKHTNDNLQIQAVTWEVLSKHIDTGVRLCCACDKYFAFSDSGDGTALYADGQAYTCTTSFARQLCNQRWVTAEHISIEDRPVVIALHNSNGLVIDSDTTH